MRKTDLGGFTFIELMLAASIFAIVAVAIYSTFGAGISAWKKAQKAQDLYQDIRLGLDKMASDLENAVKYYPKDSEFSNFEGKEDLISFYSLVDVYQTIPAHPELRKITYSLDESTPILQRLEQTFAESVQETEEQESEEIAAKVSSLKLSYCYEDKDAEPPYKWKHTWDFAQKIPWGVKIELELDAEEELVFTKYVFIPTGEKGPGEGEP